MSARSFRDLLTFPLRTVRDIQIDEDLREASERLDQTNPYVEGELHQWLELDDRGAPTDDGDDDGAKTPTEDEPALPEGSAIEDREPVVRIPLPVPRASRIYSPRVGPPASPKKRELRDDTQITFQVENPKQLSSKVHAAYEQYKAAKTVGEARALGASRSMIKYDVEKGYAVVHDQPAVLVMALVSAPLVEAWCADDSELGKVGEMRGRRVIRYTASDDLSQQTTVQNALRDIRSRRGTHLHGFIPCTPWTSWQRINLIRAKPETKERIMKDRATSLDYVRTFGRLWRAVIARGGSVSFERPRHCEGWKDETMKAMLEDLKLDPVDFDGCAVGVQSKTGEPIWKPWRIPVSSPLVRKALDGLRYQGRHTHVPCSGDETERSALYPEHLCHAIHDGLDAHESASAGDCVGKGCAAIPKGNIVDPHVRDSEKNAAESVSAARSASAGESAIGNGGRD